MSNVFKTAILVGCVCLTTGHTWGAIVADDPLAPGAGGFPNNRNPIEIGRELARLSSIAPERQPAVQPMTFGEREFRECDLPLDLRRGTHATNLWPAGVVPYEFDANVTTDNQQLALDAIGEIESVCGVDFVSRSAEVNYIHILDSDMNSSHVGMVGDGQEVWIYNWNIHYIIVHELMHALGAWHEQQRPDRDQSITIEWDNIEPEKEHNFEIPADSTANGPYDFDSVMHYRACYFSNCDPDPCSSSDADCRTITILAPNERWLDEIGQQDHLSDGDAALLASLYASCTDIFGEPVLYGVVDGPYSVTAGDLDGDGDLDLATANLISDNISVLLNNGDGTFAADVPYGAGAATRSVTAADLDDDGDVDLATANSYSDNVSVMLNNGDGTFAADVLYGAGDAPISVTAADLDGDRNLDLATANEFSDNVSVLLNNGNGTFAADVLYGAGDNPHSVTAADLDGDGDLDLATANLVSDNISVLLNNGDGIFSADVLYGTGDSPYSVTAADLDGDGKLDFVTANNPSAGIGSISVLLNHGDGTFGESVSYDAGNAPWSVTAANLDGDSDLDLATADAADDNVSLLLNNGNGTFAEVMSYGAGEGPLCVIAADLHGDGDIDLVTSNVYGDDVSVLLNLCADPGPDDPGSPCEGDANNDGLVDPLDAGYALARFGCPVDAGDPACDAADANGDSVVDPLDVGYVLSRFGECL